MLDHIIFEFSMELIRPLFNGVKVLQGHRVLCTEYEHRPVISICLVER
jgi:hypothetical protein